MFIYNVTIKVAAPIAEEWLQWMKDEHMPALLATGKFYECRLVRLLEQDDSEGPTYAAQYSCHAFTDYEAYIRDHSTAMRDAGRAKFGDGFAAFRTIMEVVA